MLRVIVASLHLIALGLGLGAVLTRGNVLREPITGSSLQRAFRADALWTIAAILWIATGLWRVFGGLEKGVAYYMHNSFFVAKMGFLLLILVIEIGPAVTLVRWRAALKKGQPAENIATPQAAKRIAMLSHIEAMLVVLMVFAAAGMARGLGMGG